MKGKERAATALRNLAVDTVSSQIAKAGRIAPLVQACSRTAVEGKERAANKLASLAVDTAPNQDAIANAGGGCSTDRHVQVRQCECEEGDGKCIGDLSTR